MNSMVMDAVMEQTRVFVVLDQTLEMSGYGLITAIVTDRQQAESYVSQKRVEASGSEQVWSVLEFPVRSLLELSSSLSMLFVVYESELDGIRPVHLYASERLAQCKVSELESSDQLRRLTEELSGQWSAPRSYWWECCPVIHG